MKRLKELLKSHFFTGLFVLIPIAVIIWIVVSTLNALGSIRDWFPDGWLPENIFPNPALIFLFNSGLTLAVVVVVAIVISILGWASKHYLGKQILDFIKHIIERIPVIRGIYGALDQLLKTLAAQGGQQFSRVVYIEYPRKGTWVLAFVTGPAHLPQGIIEKSESMLNIYVPTTPNPTSGFHLIVSESEVKPSGLKVDEAFKIILSLGITQSSGQRQPL